jgi:hypothetical protein
MAATAWTFYNEAKKKIGNNTIPLDAGIFKMQLHTSASDASTATLSIASEPTNEIAVAGGYAAGGKTLAGVAWTIAGDPSSVKFDATDLVFTASGANLSIVKFAVIHNSVGSVTSGHLLCWSRLSTNQFSVTSGNTLTIQFATAGIFTLT